MSHITKNEWTKWDLIHPLVYQALMENEFKNPTEIQSYVLNCYRNYNDFLIASQTGSGKTLSFGIPIVSDIIHAKTGTYKKSENAQKKDKYIRCLIVAPTRELVLQIEKHLNAISKHAKNFVRIVSIVGGISKDKQRRTLSYVPDILVATPGRLWDMIDNCEHECLEYLHLTDYLVLDEADRMVELGHFEELDKIIEKVHNKGETTKDKKEIENINKIISQKSTQPVILRTKGPSSMSATKLQDLGEGEVLTIEGDEALKFLEELKKNGQDLKADASGDDEDEDEEEEIDDEEDDENEGEEGDEEEDDEEELDEEDDDEEEEDLEEGDEDQEVDEEEEDDDEEEEEVEGEEEAAEAEVEGDDAEAEVEGDDALDGEDNKEEIEGEEQEGDEAQEEDLDEEEEDKPKMNTKRKLFLVSATLTQQFAGNKHKIKTMTKSEKKALNKEKKQKKKDAKKEGKEVEKEDKMIPKMEALMHKIKFSAKHKVIDLTQSMLIPRNLIELKTVCSEEDKVLYLYHYLEQRPGQSFIVFTNSISYAKKIVHLLTILGLKVLCMHSEMQQRQRLKKLDQFKDGTHKILISTDVAARGLDIPSVENVIHFQVPLDIDTFIHRSGRTARIGKTGTCYTLVGPKDGQRFTKIINQLEKNQGIRNIEINHTEREKIRVVMDKAQQLEKSNFLVRQKVVEKQWYSKNAKLADLEVDDEIKTELSQINEELVKKRTVMKQDRVEFKKVKDELKQPFRRANNMFLDPSQIHLYAQKMELAKNKTVKKLNQFQKEQLQKADHKRLAESHLPPQEDTPVRRTSHPSKSTYSKSKFNQKRKHSKRR